MSVSVYDSAEMTKAVNNLDNAQRTARLLKQFPDGDVHLSEYMEYGYDADSPRILQVRKTLEGSSPIPQTVGQLKRINFPKYRPSMNWNEIDARVLDPAVAQYMGTQTDLNSNLAGKVAKALDKLRRRVQTSHLVNCYHALSTGNVTFKYEDATSATIDYGYGSAGTGTADVIQTALATTRLWTASTSTPLADIELLAQNIRATTEYAGDFDVIMGKTAFNAFALHASVTGRLDNRRMDIGSMTFREGSEFKGSINGFDVYQVSFLYKLNTTWTEAWNTDVIAVVPRENLDWFSTEYGAIWEIPEGAEMASFIPVKYFSKSLTKKDPVLQTLIVESRPIPVIKNPLAVRIWDVTT